VITPKILQWFW